MQPYLVILPMSVDHPVLSIGADLQLEGGDVIGLLRLLGDSTLGGDAREDPEEVQVHLKKAGSDLSSSNTGRVPPPAIIADGPRNRSPRREIDSAIP